MNGLKLSAAALGVFATCVAAQASAAPAPYIYAVTVRTNFGTKFSDCFTFNGWRLTVAGLPGLLITSPAPTTPRYYYTAVPTDKLVAAYGGAIAFAGFKTGTQTSGGFSAVGSDVFKDSYTVHGTAVPSCTLTAAQIAANPYRRAAQ